MTPIELAVAAELVRLAGQVLEQAGPPPALDEPLADRLDSLQRLTLVVAIEDHFKLALSEDDTAGAGTLAAVARLVAARASPSRLPAVEAAAS